MPWKGTQTWRRGLEGFSRVVGTQDNHILKSILNSVFPKNMIEEFHGEVLSLSLTNTAEFF